MIIQPDFQTGIAGERHADFLAGDFRYVRDAEYLRVAFDVALEQLLRVIQILRVAPDKPEKEIPAQPETSEFRRRLRRTFLQYLQAINDVLNTGKFGVNHRNIKQGLTRLCVVLYLSGEVFNVPKFLRDRRTYFCELYRHPDQDRARILG